MLRSALILWLAGCAGVDGRPLPDETDPDPAPDPGGPCGGRLAYVPPALGLPFETVGTAPTGALVLRADGELCELSLSVVGPFAVEPVGGPFTGERALAVAFTGDASRPGASRGAILVDDGVAERLVAVGAVVGAPDLPEGLRWTDDGEGLSTTARLPTAPLDGDPSVFLWAPHGASAAAGTVTHLHGHYATLGPMLAEKHLPLLFARSGRDALFVVPQGPVNLPSGDFGRLMAPGGHAALVRDAIAVAYRDGALPLPPVGPAVLTAHSGGYRAAARIVEAGGLPIAAVHLHDALYGELPTFRAYAAGGVLRSSWTASGGTAGNHGTLLAQLRADGLAVTTALDDAALLAADATLGQALAAHAAVMAEDRAYARWLVETDLPARPDAPPELRYAVPAGSGRARVGWRLGRGDAGTVVIVESPPGVEVGRGAGDELVVPVDGPVAVRQVGGPPSDRYGATGSDWLVVDGFDRVIGGSWEAPTHPLGARVAATLPAATAHHAAVTAGLVDLADYARVLWMLGDESTLDHTFDGAERAAVQAFLAGGGQLVVSGSEVGYATERAFLQDVLGARFVADAAASDTANGWRLGVTWPEDYPDVLAGDEVLWRYGDGTAAAVRSDAGVVVIGFALDTLGDADLAAALTALDGLTRRASSRASAGSTRTSAPR